MFRVTREQMEVLDENNRKSLQIRLVPRLRESAAEACRNLTDSEILSKLDAAVRAGLDLGIRSDKALAQFATLALLLQSEFWKMPEVARFLALEGLSFDEKIFLLTARIEKREAIGRKK